LFTTAGAGGAAAGAGAAAGGAAAGGAAAAGGISAGAAAAAAVGSTVAGLAASKLLAPKGPSMAGMAPPTIDQAKQTDQIQQRIQQRKGVLANIYGGSSRTSAPSVARTSLLGG